ncbi:transcriptional regulator [Flavobacterium magnum]|uniref:Transcriptional regulator n=1 Tax=Flavobacterium magnum TaxID=2162713 RepID=A0A2S0RI30_9FLAO|nr:helix-turn-helix transcriptional regulator [Flavobacterium magnum]AWA30868.1 transcriptional regulator [Flavobacterium magnum]
MLHNGNFIKRLELLMKHYSLSASSFADRIGVQRSGISHLLSGRNKPSLDFILKLEEEFPEVSLYWLLKGTGSLLSQTENNESAVSEQSPLSEIMPPAPEIGTRNGDIEKIIVLYRDGSFADFSPRTDRPK